MRASLLEYHINHFYLFNAGHVTKRKEHEDIKKLLDYFNNFCFDIFVLFG